MDTRACGRDSGACGGVVDGHDHGHVQGTVFLVPAGWGAYGDRRVQE